MKKWDSFSHRERQELASRARKRRRPARPGSPRCAAPAAQNSSGTPYSFVKRFPWKKILIAFLAVLALCQAGFLIRTGYGRHSRYKAEEARISKLVEPESCELRYLIPNQPDAVETVAYGETAVLHPPVEIDGYTFLGWEKPDGSLEARSSFPVWEDSFYVARYALPLETREHIPYLEVDEDGVVDVDGLVTRREFTEILYRLLNIDRVGSGTFLDVDEDDSCYKAAATLKDIGILDGALLYPDDPVTQLELFQTLERFYPPADTVCDFPELDPEGEAYPVYSTAAAYGWILSGEPCTPSEPLTRGSLAHVVNRVLGRSFPENGTDSLVGTILDVPPTHPYYADIAEAAVPHSYESTESGELWTGSTPLPGHEPGLFFAGVRMHYINDDGSPALDIVTDGRLYNANGELTTGDAELDRTIWAILEECINPKRMSSEEMLLAVYNYVCDNFSPDVDTLYKVGAEGWALTEATRFLENGRGSSYGYSALFYELAYMIGYQPTLYSGIIYGTQTVFEDENGVRIEAPKGFTMHAWTEITFDGISYIFDPSMESKIDSNRIFFKRNSPIRWQYGYRTALWWPYNVS